MGEVKVDVEFENFVDRAQSRRFPEIPIRSFKTLALVDSGAVMSMLPIDIVEHLGLSLDGTAIVTPADESKLEMKIAEAVTVKLAGRSTMVPCLVGPPTSEPLIGQVVLEVLDLLVDCPGQRVVPNPDSPIYPMLNLK